MVFIGRYILNSAEVILISKLVFQFVPWRPVLVLIRGDFFVSSYTFFFNTCLYIFLLDQMNASGPVKEKMGIFKILENSEDSSSECLF